MPLSHTEQRSRWRFLPLAAGQPGNLQKDFEHKVFLCLNIGSVGFTMMLNCCSNYNVETHLITEQLFLFSPASCHWIVLHVVH